MKKFILSAMMALSCGVLFATDYIGTTDMYLYWMIDETAGGLDANDYTVKLAASSDNGQTAAGYLYLYGNPGESAAEYRVSDVKGLEAYAGIGELAGYSFFVELWNDSSAVLKSEVKSYSDLSGYISSMKGMSTPANAYGFSSFTAVPEPTSGLLLLLGVAGLALRRKNKKA